MKTAELLRATGLSSNSREVVVETTVSGKRIRQGHLKYDDLDSSDTSGRLGGAKTGGASRNPDEKAAGVEVEACLDQYALLMSSSQVTDEVRF